VAVRQRASERVLVVKATHDDGGVRDRLAEFGTVEDRSDVGVVLLRLDSPRSDLEAARAEILDRIEGVEWAEPLLVDDSSSSPLVPTGELSVRFHEPLSDEELVRFADEHGLELRRRNQFVREQATFAPRERRREPLTEQVEKLSHERAVRKAWPNTASQYRRA
jgi:hypothetical protein